MRTATWCAAVLWLTGCGEGAGGPSEASDAGVDSAIGSSEPDAATASADAMSGAGDASPQQAVSDASTSARDGALAVPVPRPQDDGTLGWKTCLDKYQCGSLRVPLDYSDPMSATLKVALMRRLATGTRVGALLINPGGPGSSAVDYLDFFAQAAAKSPLLERFDLIAFDPRGVGYSTPLDCHSTLQKLVAADPTPDSEAEWTALDDASAAFAAECASKSPELLPFVGTVNVARDMEQVRAALGEDKLDYLGFSYGGSIGAWYAELFPTHVGRFVLDGAVDLALSALDLQLGQAKGFELALSHYFSWCNEEPSRCTWTQGAPPAEAFATVLAAVEATPIPAPKSDRKLGPGEFLLAVSATMYGGQAGWVALSPALRDARAGDASGLMTFVDNYLERAADSSYANLTEMNYAVSCVDQASPTVAEVRAQAARFASEAPNFGVRALTGELVCSHWPVPGKDVPAPTGRGAPPIVVIGTLNDPATPYAWAQAFAKALVSSVLLSSNGEGHTGYGRGDTCIDDAVNAFLIDGVVPQTGCATALTKGRNGQHTSAGAGSLWLPHRH